MGNQAKGMGDQPCPRDIRNFETNWSVPLTASTTPTAAPAVPRYSCLLAGLIPHARVKIYPDSAHGFLFQHYAEFAADVQAFLSCAS